MSFDTKCFDNILLILMLLVIYFKRPTATVPTSYIIYKCGDGLITTICSFLKMYLFPFKRTSCTNTNGKTKEYTSN